MNQISKHRLPTILATILAGTALLQAVQFYLLPPLPPAVSIFITLFAILLSAALGVWLDARLSSNNKPPEAILTDDQRLQTELHQLNQELFSRAQEQAEEMARLNIELQLQMAKYQHAEETALASEERFRNMADNIQEGLTIIENGELVYYNERACEIFGDCPNGDIRQRIVNFAAPEERQRLLQTISEAESLATFPQELEFWIERPDDQRRCVREQYTTTLAGDISRTFIVTSDITAAAQAYHLLENAVGDRTRELSTVLDVSRRITSTLELEPLLNLILDQIQAIIPYSGAAIFTLEEDNLYAAAYQLPRLPFQDTPIYLALEDAAPYRQVVAEKQVIIIDDINGDSPLLRSLQENSAGLPVSTQHAHSWIGIPLIVRDQVIGLLSLTHSKPNYYTQRHTRLALTITNQVAIAIENARLYEQAQNLAVLEERHRIARELHDSVTQLLYGICLYCTATSRSLRSSRQDGEKTALIEENLAEIKDNALQALQEMRLLILELNPPLLQKAGLVAALQASLEVIETRTGLETELVVEGVNRLPRLVEAQLYRIAMEALNNLVRYAHARKVSVDLRSSDGWIWMEICDNGVGFDIEQTRSGSGMGLHNMEQRARQLRGSLEVVSSPGRGTRIRVEAPVMGTKPEPAIEKL